MIEAGILLQNRYRIERHIGQGGMGTVYIATDERFGSKVAIKETLFSEEKYRKAFEREARLLNSLKHSALPRVSDHFTEGNGQFLVMEYIEGDDLSEIMEREKKAFALDAVLNWTDQLLDALEYLHSQEMPVIHRDIKPQNLKLTPQGQIVLLDFGLAKGNVTNPESATAAKSMFGYSRNYASLEQIQGTGTDPRSDLYSLGATVYHLITGVPPADALTRAMNVLSDKDDPLIPAHKITANIPENISEILCKIMALNAKQRPVSAKEMRTLFEENKIGAENRKTNAQTPVATNIFTQDTQVPAENPKQSNIRTELLPDNRSEATILKPLTSTNKASISRTGVSPKTKTENSRRGLAIGAAIGGLLLAGSAFAGLYIFKSDDFSANSNINSNNSNVERMTTVVNSSAQGNHPVNADIPSNLSTDWTFSERTNSSNQSPQKQETAKTEENRQVQQEEPQKTENKETKNEAVVKENQDKTVKEEPVERPNPNPSPVVPKVPVFPNRFPRFPQNQNNPNREEWEREQRRREIQRQRRQQQEQQQQPRPQKRPY